jgi:STE24 endopeptidase
LCIEKRFGFNKMTWPMWLVQMACKGVALGIRHRPADCSAILWLMGAAGDLLVVLGLGVWMGFNLLLMWIFPHLHRPAFQQIQPLEDEALKTACHCSDAALRLSQPKAFL